MRTAKIVMSPGMTQLGPRPSEEDPGRAGGLRLAGRGEWGQKSLGVSAEVTQDQDGLMENTK